MGAKVVRIFFFRTEEVFTQVHHWFQAGHCELGIGVDVLVVNLSVFEGGHPHNPNIYFTDPVGPHS